jgi:hypothetical protein
MSVDMHNVKSTVMLLFVVACTGKSAPPTSEMECTPSEFLGCADGKTALRCNAEGTDEVTETCLESCDAEAERCNVCVPNKRTCRVDGSVHTCGADGLSESVEACAAGCNNDGACNHIVPVWIPDACDVPAAVAQRKLLGSIDTANATLCDRIVQQKTPAGAILGPEICIVAARALEIGDLKVIGPRAIAFVGDEVSVTGLLDVTADGTRSGPGVYVSNGQFDTTYGGGGAGFRQPGAPGGGNEFGANARQGGPIRNPLAESAFSGGTRPGDDTGITAFDDPVVGGAGGGALIVACRGTASVTPTGNIDAGGGGGMRGLNGHGGAAGGSGGYVVLQGANVKVTGFLTVNGGGGGAACQAPVLCTDGLDAFGSAGTNAGEGGSGGSAGGRGGKVDAPPSAGANAESGITGAGGGAVGMVQVYTPAGVTPTLMPQRPVVFEANRNITVR